MANTKSAKKRIGITARNNMRNRIVKSKVRTAIRKVVDSLQSNNKTQVDSMFKLAIATIDQSVSKGVYHKNNGARKKSRLAKLISKSIVS